MSTTFSNLFARRSRPVRPARPRLGVESLDERALQSVTTASLTGGVLTIGCDTYNTTAVVKQVGDKIQVLDDYSGKNGQLGLAKNVPVSSFAAADVQKIVYTGGQNADKWYTFTNQTDIDADYKLQNAKGFDTVYGGSGVNSFYTGRQGCYFHGGGDVNHFYDIPNTEADYFAGGAGSLNVLHRSGARTTGVSATIRDPFSGRPAGEKITLGLDPNAYKSYLNGAGDMTASLEGQDLVLSGPSGAGFKLRGKWENTTTVDANGLYTHSFKSTGVVTLVTGSALKDFPINTSLTSITITTKAGRFKESVGVFNTFAMGGGGFALPAGGMTDKLKALGISAALPQAKWGLALGKDLIRAGGALAGAPLNAGVPYLYAAVGSADGSAASVGFGNTTASVGSAGGVQVAFDPADPFVFVQVATGTSAGTWAAGYSVNGVIPFSPEKLPEDMEDIPNVNGNVYLSGKGISLGSLPASVSGEVVIDLDANGDGKMAGGSLSQMLGGKIGAAESALNDMALGVNGEVSLGYKIGGFVDLSVKAGEATLIYAPGTNGEPSVLGLRGGHANPFANTALEKFAPKTGEIELSGVIKWGNDSMPHWNIIGTMTNRGAGGFFGSQMRYQINDFTITAGSSYYADFYVAKANMNTEFTLGYDTFNKRVFLYTQMHGDIRVGVDGYNLHASVDAKFDIFYQAGSIWFDGSARASGGVTFMGGDIFDVGVSARVNNNGFRLDLPSPFKDISIAW